MVNTGVIMYSISETFLLSSLWLYIRTVSAHGSLQSFNSGFLLTFNAQGCMHLQKLLVRLNYKKIMRKRSSLYLWIFPYVMWIVQHADLY